MRCWAAGMCTGHSSPSRQHDAKFQRIRYSLHLTCIPGGTLTDIKRVVNNQAVEMLTQYRYDEHGQLNAVVNRNGETVRTFSYSDGLMVSHSNALGLTCHYRWDILACKSCVVDHWTSDGEHYRFRYDIDARISWATDVLGHELQVHYNADHRVIRQP